MREHTIAVFSGCCVFETGLVPTTPDTVHQCHHWVPREELRRGRTRTNDPSMDICERRTAAGSANRCCKFVVTQTAVVPRSTQ